MYFTIAERRLIPTLRVIQDFAATQVVREVPAGFPRGYRWLTDTVVEAHALPNQEKPLQLCLYRLQAGRHITIPSDVNDLLWTQLDRHLFHKNGASLTTCAAEFLALHRRYANPMDARTNCWYASKEFLTLLLSRKVIKQQDVDSRRVAIKGRPFPCRGSWHAWFQIGRIVVDWTYRQFDPDSPFPLICHERDYPFHYEAIDWTDQSVSKA